MSQLKSDLSKSLIMYEIRMRGVYDDETGRLLSDIAYLCKGK